jgi:hypothetical protein
MKKNKVQNQLDTEKLLAVATQITDKTLRGEFLKLIPMLKDPNARAEMDGIQTLLSADLATAKVATVIGASLRKIDIQAEEMAKKAPRQTQDQQV